MAGEGGEYESIVLDCPIYKKRIEIVESKIVKHSEGVWYLDIVKVKLVDKEIDEMKISNYSHLVKSLVFKDDNLGLDDIGIESLELSPKEILVPVQSTLPIFTQSGRFLLCL